MRRRRVQPELTWESSRIGKAGEERIALLEAVRDTGSISAAAKKIGLSYRAAWDAVQVLNNLFAKPVVVAEAGGKRGGGTTLTPEGNHVIRSYRAMQSDFARATARLQQEISTSDVQPLPWTLRLRTSTRNAFSGTVATVTRGAVNAEVALAIADNVTLTAIVTNTSVEELALAPGTSAVALVNPSWVVLAHEEEVGRTSARNRLSGVVSERRDGAVNSEIVLSLGNGKTLSAIVTKESAEALDLRTGDRACALVKASHIVLLVQG